MNEEEANVKIFHPFLYKLHSLNITNLQQIPCQHRDMCGEKIIYPFLLTILIPVLYRILNKVKYNRQRREKRSSKDEEGYADPLFLLLFPLENEQSKNVSHIKKKTLGEKKSSGK